MIPNNYSDFGDNTVKSVLTGNHLKLYAASAATRQCIPVVSKVSTQRAVLFAPSLWEALSENFLNSTQCMNQNHTHNALSGHWLKTLLLFAQKWHNCVVICESCRHFYYQHRANNTSAHARMHIIRDLVDYIID